MKNISAKITSKSLAKSYSINLEDDFALSFEKDWKALVGNDKFIDAGDLLRAFIEKSYENYLQSKQLKVLVDKLDNYLAN